MFEGSVNRVISKRITWLGVIALAAGIGLACQEQRSPTEPDPADLKPRLTLSGDTVVSGFGTPTIDGAITGAEWGSAGIIAVPVNVPGGGVAPGSLFVMNDANNLYVALQFQHSTSGGSLGVEFDNDADGTAEDGDDVILFNAGADDFFDDFRTSNATDPGICPNAAPASCGPQDTDDGGTEDGAGAFQDHGTFSIYEMSHPLDSADDDHDFSLTTASQVGAFLSLRIPDPGDGFADTDFPGFRDYMLIVLSGGVITLSLDNQGSPVVGQVVTAVERTRGPFRVDGSLATAVTDMNGTATIGGLPVPGDYCLHVRPLTSLDDAAAKGNNLVVPPGGAVPAAPTGRPAAIIDGVFDALPMTRDNYLAHCVDNPNTPPTVVLDGQNPEAALQRTIQPPSEGVTVKVNFLDLEGNPTFLPGWGIIGDPDDPVPLPWFQDFAPGLPPDVTPGLLVSAAPADLQTGEVTISGLAPEAFPMASAGPNANANANAGIPIQIESGITEVGDQGTLSFSTNVTVADPGGVVDLGPQVMEPQMCAVDRNDEPEGDLPGKHARHRGNRRHGVDLIGPVKDGFRADAQLDPVDDLSIFYNQEGDGHVGLLMFFREGGFRVAPLLALYRCRDGDCEFLRAQGRALRLGISADAKFADLGDGLLRATWLIENVPGDVEAIRYRLFTQGDRFPNGFPFLESVDLPDLCTGGLSNDPRFWIGG